jgi:hypothetical protein
LSYPLPSTIAPTCFNGWALARATALDLNVSRGILADIASASVLKRQAAFAALASVELDDPQPFLSRLGISDGTISDAIRKCRARDLLAAAFEVDTVPSGYLRAAVRIGLEPLSDPRLYRRLFEIFSAQDHRKAHALRYCGDHLNAVKIQAVDVLDPLLLEPEIVKHLYTIGDVHRANLLLRFLRQSCFTANDETLVTGLRQAIGWGGLAGVVRRFLKRADLFPPAPLEWDPEIRYLDSGAALCALAREMRNCLADRIAEVLLGFNSYYVARISVADGLIPVAIELSPLSSGHWKISGIYGPKNKPVPVPQRKPLVAKLVRMGAVVEAHPANLHPQAKSLVEPLNVHRWNDLLPLEEKNEEPPEVELVLREIDREFGLT